MKRALRPQCLLHQGQALRVAFATPGYLRIYTFIDKILELIKFRVSQAHKYRAILGGTIYPISEAVEAGLIDEVVDEEEDDVVPLCSSPNLAAASAMIACEAAEVAAASFKILAVSLFKSGLEVELNDSEEPDELLGLRLALNVLGAT